MSLDTCIAFQSSAMSVMQLPTATRMGYVRTRTAFAREDASATQTTLVNFASMNSHVNQSGLRETVILRCNYSRITTIHKVRILLKYTESQCTFLTTCQANLIICSASDIRMTAPNTSTLPTPMPPPSVFQRPISTIMTHPSRMMTSLKPTIQLMNIRLYLRTTLSY